MNDECVWRMLGEYVCDRLLKKCFVTLSMQSMCDDIQYLYKSFGNKLEINCNPIRHAATGKLTLPALTAIFPRPQY